MAHPMKKEMEGVTGHNAKLKRMTAHYGDADSSMKKNAPVDILKSEGGEDAVGYGADSSTAKARSDRPARRAVAANPVATYRKGGVVKHKARHKAKHRAEGGDVSAIEEANKNQAAANRARGGRTKHKGTHVNVIVAPQGGSPAPGAAPVLPLGANPALPPGMPPRPPVGLSGGPGMVPPMGGPGPMMAGAPGGLPPGVIPPRARGGKVAHPDEAEDRAMIKTMVKPSALKRARGGRLPSQKHHMTAGAVTGEGRLEKIGKKGHNAGKPQEV
jgi:hypothetical protein